MNSFLFATALPGILASASTAPTVQSILADILTFFTWCLTQMTALSTWVAGNPFAMTFIGMFVIGFIVSVLVRVLHSV